MSECKLYPEFSIRLDYGLEARYRKNDKRFEKHTFHGLIDTSLVPEWKECSMVNYALALLLAHEQEATK